MRLSGQSMTKRAGRPRPGSPQQLLPKFRPQNLVPQDLTISIIIALLASSGCALAEESVDLVDLSHAELQSGRPGYALELARLSRADDRSRHGRMAQNPRHSNFGRRITVPNADV